MNHFFFLMENFLRESKNLFAYLQADGKITLKFSEKRGILSILEIQETAQRRSDSAGSGVPGEAGILI